MARNFSDIFRSDDSDSQQNSSTDSSTSSDTNFDGNAENGTNVSNDGINVSSEHYTQDEDGNVSYDSNSLDTGGLDIGNNLNLDSILSNVTDGMNSSDSDSSIDN